MLKNVSSEARSKLNLPRLNKRERKKERDRKSGRSYSFHVQSSKNPQGGILYEDGCSRDYLPPPSRHETFSLLMDAFENKLIAGSS